LWCLPRSIYMHPLRVFITHISTTPFLFSFSRALPSRFRKEVLQPYVGSNGDVDVEQLNSLLKNIGHSQDCLSEQEQNELLEASGSSTRSIPVEKMMELID
jgi:hypothetical protein